MTDRRVPPDQGGLDWRRLAADLNVSHGVAKGLWQRARETSPDDPTQAARAFQGMLEEAAEADATQEPGRET
ncbi:MAG: hypothetical protein H7138_18965, partial [Myxococcales bacterium]|nr:hypothetical protein [Myxococcales bacterium]